MALAAAWRAGCLSRGVGPFSNRRYGLKCLAALALIAAIGFNSADRGDFINPPLRACAAHPEKWINADLWVSDAQVVSVDDTGFVIVANDTRMPVRGKADVAVNEMVWVRGTLQKDEAPYLKLIRWRKRPADWRRLMEWGSLAVFALIALNFLRHFAFRREALAIRGR